MQLEENKNYNVELLGSEIALIQNALMELPFKFTAGLINKLPEKIKEIENTKKVEGQ